MRPRLTLSSILGVTLLVLVPASAQAKPQYSIIDIIATAGRPIISTAGFDVNDRNEVTGSFRDFSPPDDKPYFYSAEGLQDLGTYPDAYFITPQAINNFGKVVGVAELDNGFVPVVYENGQWSAISGLGLTDGVANGVNDAGTVSGWMRNADFTGTRAFVFQNGTMSLIDTLGGGNNVGQGMSPAGYVSGTSETASGEYHAFLYKDGQVLDIGGAGFQSFGAAVNDLGHVAGYRYTGNAQNRAVLFANGSVTELGTLGSNFSAALAMNNAGQIVGNSDTSTGRGAGFLYEKGQMWNLNSILVEGITGYEITNVRSINEAGWILAEASGPYGRSAVLLKPVPEPASIAALGLGIVAVLRRRKRA